MSTNELIAKDSALEEKLEKLLHRLGNADTKRQRDSLNRQISAIQFKRQELFAEFQGVC